MQSLCYSSPQQLEFCRTHQHTSCRFCGRIGGQLVQLIDCRGDQGNATVWDRKMMAEEIATHGGRCTTRLPVLQDVSSLVINRHSTLGPLDVTSIVNPFKGLEFGLESSIVAQYGTGYDPVTGQTFPPLDNSKHLMYIDDFLALLRQGRTPIQPVYYYISQNRYNQFMQFRDSNQVGFPPESKDLVLEEAIRANAIRGCTQLASPFVLPPAPPADPQTTQVMQPSNLSSGGGNNELSRAFAREGATLVLSPNVAADTVAKAMAMGLPIIDSAQAGPKSVWILPTVPQGQEHALMRCDSELVIHVVKWDTALPFQTYRDLF